MCSDSALGLLAEESLWIRTQLEQIDLQMLDKHNR